MKTVSYWFNIFKELIINNERTKIETFADCTKKNTLERIGVITNFSRMDNFIVSARKYRPETFASVVGQASITGTLKSAIKKNQLGHAYLFCGPRGVGKTTCARIFAKTINCTNPGADAEPCNQCESCLSFNESRSFNIHELDAASNNSVDDIRNLNEQVRIPPQLGKYSVYIIDEVHMLSAQAFNAFLKTLEEPPAHAVFVLATTEKHKIIPTILSRCQIFDFNRIRAEDITAYLEYIAGQEGIEYEADAFNIVALKADGAMRDALSIFDQMVSFSGKTIRYSDVIENLNILDYEYYFRLTENCYKGGDGEALMIFDEILSKGFDARNFLSGFGSHLRDLLVCQDEVTLKLLEVGAGIREKYRKQSIELDPEWLFRALDVLGTSEASFRSSRNQRLHVELTLLRLCRIGEDSKKKVLIQEIAPEDKSIPASRNAKTADKLSAEEKEIDLSAQEKAAAADPGPPKEGEQPAQSAAEGVPRDESTPKRPAVAGGRPGSLPSIKDALNGVHKEKGGDRENDSGKKEAAVMSAPFSQEDLISSWNAYTESIRDSRPRMANSLRHHPPTLGDALQIELVLSNSAQLEEFNRDIKPELVIYLEKALQNNQFRLLPVVSEDEARQKTLYTSEEKYEHMLKKNPELGKLKERFNLDFE
jgi:DNA polymerase-3 subunit gamma/tau